MKFLNLVVQKMIFGGSRTLRPYELLCLEAYFKLVPASVRGILRRQLEAVDFVHRNTKDMVVICHFFDVEGDQIPLLANRELEVVAAVVTLVGDGKTFKVDVLVENGVLAGLRFGKSPRGLIGKTVEVESVEVMIDASEKPNVAPLERIPEGTILARIAERIEVAHAKAPALSEQIRVYLGRFECPIPADLEELLSATDGFEFPCGSFDGIHGHVLSWPEGQVYILAEDERQLHALCLREGEGTAAYYVFDKIDGEFEGPFASIVDAMERLANRASVE